VILELNNIAPPNSKIEAIMTAFRRDRTPEPTLFYEEIRKKKKKARK